MELIYQQNNYQNIHVYSCCIPVKGSERGAIYDLQREDIELVPNTMIDFLNHINRKKVNDVLKEFEFNKMAKKYLNFLEKKEFIFYSNKKYFPDLPIKSINEDTSIIYCATIFFSNYIKNNLNTIIENISELGVKRLHFHINHLDCMEEVSNILLLLQNTRVINLSFSFPYQKIEKKLYEDKRLKTVYIFNSPKENIKRNKEVSSIFITSSANNLFSPKFGLKTIEINTNTYNIANNYNLSLYKTIFIDEKGVIRFNSLDKISYGNITDSWIDINHITIKKLSEVWNIKKTEISPCNVCEFRFCCTATYIPIKKNNKYEVKCNYNPHTNELQ